MNRNLFYIMLWALFVLLNSCADETTVTSFNEDSNIVEILLDEEEDNVSIPVKNIMRDGNTRALYRFQSENLSVTRWYQTGDYVLAINPSFYYTMYKTYANASKKLNRLYYMTSSNDFSTVSTAKRAEAGTTFNTTMLWTIYKNSSAYKIGGVTQKIQNTDTVMFAIFDKNNTDAFYAAERYKPTDTTIVQGLTSQKGTKADCFSRQVPWVRYPKGLWTGTHVWKDLTAYYWLILLYDSTDVASIDTVHMHADEGLASKLYFKYNATVSMDCTIWDGPYAIGVDTMYAIAGNEYQDYNKRADVFISFFPGLKTNNVFHNFGFDVGWTDKFGNKHYTYEPMNREDVRPQAKVASPGNVYRDAMGLSLDHGLQNLYEDEVVEINKWDTKVDSTIIIKKD